MRWASPHHDDLGNTSWWRITECAACAETCGRPVTAEQIQAGQHQPEGDQP